MVLSASSDGCDAAVSALSVSACSANDATVARSLAPVTLTATLAAGVVERPIAPEPSAAPRTCSRETWPPGEPKASRLTTPPVRVSRATACCGVPSSGVTSKPSAVTRSRDDWYTAAEPPPPPPPEQPATMRSVGCSSSSARFVGCHTAIESGAAVPTPPAVVTETSTAPPAVAAAAADSVQPLSVATAAAPAEVVAHDALDVADAKLDACGRVVTLYAASAVLAATPVSGAELSSDA